MVDVGCWSLRSRMNISAPFIRRPVGTALLTVAVALAGIVAYLQLPVAPLPQVDFPTISVQAALPGASPEIMASSVAAPLERQLGHIAGVSEMTSASYLGSTSITLQFDLSRNIDGAARDVQAAINAARANLPANLPSNPTYRKVNPADSPIMILALTSEVYDRGQLYDAASTIIQQRLLEIEGVGQLADDRTTADILANDQLLKAENYKPLIVTYRNGAAVRLSDIANVQDSVENVRAAGFVNGKPSISLILFRQPGANIIETVDRIWQALPSLKASIPAAINLMVVLDRTTTIRASVFEVERTLVIAIALVILVVSLFLRNARTTLIPAAVVPVSLIGTFGVMYLCHYSLDNLSLMALTISTGFVVDDAIVVIENISRHIEGGMKPFEAAMKGASEIGFTVLSMSTSLVAVFIPILMMGGVVGRLFREFAVVLSVAIAVSLFVSLTTTPMMCARFLRHETGEHNRLYRFSENAFNRLLRTYDFSLRWVLRHQFLILLVTLGTVCLNVYLFIQTPKGFFPRQDTGRINGSIIGDQDLSFAAMSKKMRTFTDIVSQDPAVDSVISFTGGGSGGSTARLFSQLKPLSERKLSADQVIARIRSNTAGIPGATLYLQTAHDLT